ncbi:CGNR zinc finger domain-containing protein [Janthinobacterium lividum]
MISTASSRKRWCSMANCAATASTAAAR